MKKLLLLLCIGVSFLLSSCLQTLSMDDYNNAEKKSQEQKKNPDIKAWKGTTCTIDQVALKSFKIKSSLNEKVLSDILFTADDGVHFTGVVEHYILRERRLIVTWDCIAQKVTVNDKEQTPSVDTLDFSRPVTYRFYASDGKYKEFTFEIKQGSYSNLPVVSVETASKNYSKTQWIDGTVKVAGNNTEYVDVSYPMTLKARGNNSNSQKKRSFTIRLDERNKMLGMNKHKRWTLIASAPDRTQLRNCVAYEIASRTALAWTPSTRHCEVILNNEYVGLYEMIEQIRIDKNRVNITEYKLGENAADTLSGGYLLEFDRYPETVSFKTAVRELPVNIKSPDSDIISQAHIDYIKDYLKKIEQLLYEKETPDPAYRDYIDLASFADVWIILELTNCKDATIPGSIWYYKDRGGKLFAGPVWDFDLTTFMNSSSFLLYGYETTDFTSKNRSLWYSRLFRDPVFKAMVKERWMQYMPAFLTIPEFIDAQADMIKDAADRNFQIWTATGWNKDESLAWRDAVDLLKENYLYRLNALNNAISKW